MGHKKSTGVFVDALTTVFLLCVHFLGEFFSLAAFVVEPFLNVIHSAENIRDDFLFVLWLLLFAARDSCRDILREDFAEHPSDNRLNKKDL